MPFTIIRNNITKVAADAIVNSANPLPVYAGQTDKTIYQAAGAEKLLAERRKIGIIEPGNIAVTPAFNLKSRYIIHAVGPNWIDGSHNEEKLLAQCLKKALETADDLDCASIALPFISTGFYQFPKEKALKVFTDVIYDHLMKSDLQVILVMYDDESFDLSRRLFSEVTDFLDEDRSALKSSETVSFHDYLIQLMNESGLKNSEIYHGANISKQHFSKMISSRDYMPSKNTICALAISMKLDLQTTLYLLEKAGYVLSDSIAFDRTVRYFIVNRLYNIVDDNIILFSNDLDMLGTQ